jgi:hypothetical protein
MLMTLLVREAAQKTLTETNKLFSFADIFCVTTKELGVYIELNVRT